MYSIFVRRETGHTHKHPTRTNRHNTRHDNNPPRVYPHALLGLTLRLTRFIYIYICICICIYIYIYIYICVCVCVCVCVFVCVCVYRVNPSPWGEGAYLLYMYPIFVNPLRFYPHRRSPPPARMGRLRRSSWALRRGGSRSSRASRTASRECSS